MTARTAIEAAERVLPGTEAPEGELDPRWQAIIQVAEQETDEKGCPGVLGFHLLVPTRANYGRLGGDPFLLAERFPPPWEGRGELPSLTWPDEPLPRRTVADVQRVLQRPEGPSLLGGA